MPLTIASVNVNGLRAAAVNGMAGWWAQCRPDVVTMQEVRAPDALVPGLVAGIAGAPLHVAHGECGTKGRAGVAVVSTRPILEWSVLDGCDAFDAGGRWVEARVALDDADDDDGAAATGAAEVTVVSAYVHTGDADDPGRMREKLAFMDAMADRLTALRAAGRHVVLTGDLNVGHRELDIKNWKGNLKKAGFLPEERAWFDRLLADGWVDVVRRHAGDVAGPYTWWSWRGKAFDLDSGWRIDYHIATPDLDVSAVRVDRAASYAERWSDHAPVVVTYGAHLSTSGVR